MKKQAYFLMLLCATVLFVSCEKEAYITSSELNARELQKFVDDNGIATAEVYLSRVANGNESYIRVEERTPFRILDSHLVAEESGIRYNLDRMIYYDVRSLATGNMLRIYLK